MVSSYGHGRYEIAGSVFIALMLIGAGAFVGYEGIAKLISREEQLVEYVYPSAIVWNELDCSSCRRHLHCRQGTAVLVHLLGR